MVISFLFRIGELLLGVTTDTDIQESFLIKSFIHSNTDGHKEYNIYFEERPV
jgi:hypothetical protein